MAITAPTETIGSLERYMVVTKQKEDGVHYTPTELAGFVAKQITKEFQPPTGRNVRVFDPAVGDGELLVALLAALQEKEIFDIEIYGFDINSEALDVARRRIQHSYPTLKLSLMCRDFLDFVSEQQGDGSLFSTANLTKFDLIISNPPYVRTQVMGSKQSKGLSELFGLSGRVDLYHAFLYGMGRVLEPAGLAGVIVSNRFMSTKTGSSVRRDLLCQFNPKHIWDFGDTRLFAAAVLPAVMLLEKKSVPGQVSFPANFSTIYTSKLSGVANPVNSAIDAINYQGLVELASGERFLIEHGVLDHGKSPGDIWRISTTDSETWMTKVDAHTWATFGDIGNIRVGVKTTADKVFIRSDWSTFSDSETPELLRPLTTHHIARRYRATIPEKPRGIVYPHTVKDGKRCAVDLSAFPKTRAYLEESREILEARTYVREANRNWYEIWVPHDPELWPNPKLVFRDISEKPTFWMDLEGSVVNGDCYWLTSRNDKEENLLWLALAVANSTFTETFYDRKFNNKLYAGRRRFITQYVEHFPLPNPELTSSKEAVKLSRQLYDKTPSVEADTIEAKLDQLIWQSFGLSYKEL